MSATMKISSESGFTLTELLVALAIVGVVGALTASTFSSYQAGFTTQNQIATLQQDLGGALYIMEREVRMAAFDPTRSAGAGVSDLSTTVTLVFTADLDESGDINATEEITYTLFDYGDPPRSALGRRIRGGRLELVAQFVDRLAFEYLDVDGNPAVFTEDIREIGVELEGSTQKATLDEKRVLSARIPLKNAGL
jgi:prepilin-type N-terminal cleavage/methylation domain-containing protein